MPDDTLPRIAILGAGPIGLEATLYARYLGYPVTLLERGTTPAANLQQWGHVQLFTPFAMNASPLGVAAIEAQDPQWQRPDAAELLTGREHYLRYLQPLAESDLVAGALQCETEVLAIGRGDWLKREGVGDRRRGEAVFHILLRDPDGVERIAEADLVIDCTGTYGNPNWLGQGGIPARGELAAAEHVEYGLPDLTGRDKPRYVGKQTLVIGAGYSAATVIVQLANFDDAPQRVTWITRGDGPAPIRRIADDRLADRDTLAKDANQLAAEQNGPIAHHAATSVVALEYRSATDDFEVELAGQRSRSIVVDRIIANVGARPDNQIYAELHIHECYASGAPMKLAAALLQNSSASESIDCLDQTACGPESLKTSEPGFYILGSKSYGRGAQFLLSIGMEQIRDLFTIIGEREDLDLYASMPGFNAESAETQRATEKR